MNKEQQIVPELRFPEFLNDGFWVYKKLGDYEELSSGDGDWILSKNINTDGEYQIVQLSSIGFGNFKEKELKTISKETFNELKGTPILKGDLLINRMVDSDKINNCIFPKKGDYVTSVDVCWIRENSLINNYFLMNLLCTNGSQIKLLSLSSGAGRVRISKRNLFERFVFAIPTNPKEQQKIANCLSSLDEVINAETEKLELLQNHKKGLLQQLFPQEGETQPKYRFPEFKEDGDWEVKSIEQVCEKPYSGGTPSSTNKDYYGGEIPFIRSAEIDKDFTGLFLTKLGLKNSSAKMVKKGDVLVAMYGANSGDVGISKINGAINQAVLCLRSKTNNVFLYQYLVHKKDWITNKYLQGGQGNLSGDIIKSVELMFPKPTEQLKIANFLSSIDELIEAQSQKIEGLQNHKKGLLQQLFPNINDVVI